MQKIIKAEVGEKYTIPKRYAGSRSTDIVVATACQSNSGYWYCMTHDKSFENQFQKDSHIHTGTHKLAWVCYEHGFERP